MLYSFIHLSDLHFQQDRPEAVGLITKHLVIDLEKQLSRYENPYVIFSGDLVNHGGAAEQHRGLIEGLGKELNRLGIGVARRFSVPGNHDVSRTAVERIARHQHASLQDLKSESQFLHDLPTLTQLFFKAKFADYEHTESVFAQYTCCTKNLSGSGWQLDDEVSVYCLNTALCSYAGCKNTEGHIYEDERHLMVDTRSLHKWLQNDRAKTRILIMHHPLDWLRAWAKSELLSIINENFKIVFCGHVHAASSESTTRGGTGVITTTAPALFSDKNEKIGYAVVQLDSSTQSVNVTYRQWAGQRFVTGSVLSGTENGEIAFSNQRQDAFEYLDDQPRLMEETPGILDREFRESARLDSRQDTVWVDREIAFEPEPKARSQHKPEWLLHDLLTLDGTVIVRAPKQYGLSATGRYLAKQYFTKFEGRRLMIVMDAAKCGSQNSALLGAIKARCKELRAPMEQIEAIVLDNWQADKHGRSLLVNLRKLFPQKYFLVLNSLDDCEQISDSIASADGEDPLSSARYAYLWALSRGGVRQMVTQYLSTDDSLDPDQVTNKIVADIDTLNIHRTPLNCLILLKLLEQAADFSPVNRTEMISRVLAMLFMQCNKLPTYASRPDLKDCEHALGYFAEKLIRARRSTFSKSELYEAIGDYCKKQMIDIDLDILFLVLYTENILLKKWDVFQFRFNYWLYYFAAHRMHHDAEFSEFMLSGKRYSAYPEILEFYTGIDRRREDAVIRITADLRAMNDDLTSRTGIPIGFNPFELFKWSPNEQALAALQAEVSEGELTAVPVAVKDAIADRSYDRSKPYFQELATFVDRSSLVQLTQAMRGAARALRNSDYVNPEAKLALMGEVFRCWERVCQVLTVISPVLARAREASFEGINFMLDESFDTSETPEDRWRMLIGAIFVNVVMWYEDDIFSRKMSPLLRTYISERQAQPGALLALMVMARQRASGWEEAVETFIVEQNKESFYLGRLLSVLRTELKYAASTERSRSRLRKLAAMSIAKHQTGVNHPGKKLVERAAQQVIDKQDAPSRGRSKFF